MSTKNMLYKIIVINSFRSPVSNTPVEEGTILAESWDIDTIKKIHHMLVPEFRDNSKIIKTDDVN